jgi:hypothetical protein
VFDEAVTLPLLDFRAMEIIAGGVAFAEQQPVAALAGGDACFDYGAQPGEPSAVADEQQRLCVGGRMKVRVATDA